MRTKLRLPIAEREAGAALITVLGVGALITALLTTLIVVAVAGARHAGSDADRHAALAAAYAGIEEYRSRLDANPGYIDFGNPEADFGGDSGLSLPPHPNPAFGIGDSWATVPNSPMAADESSPASFRYEVDTSTYDRTGIVRLRSTGRVGDATRTVIADLRKPGFTDYVYFTDYETSYGDTRCHRYNHDLKRHSDCRISFAGGDNLHGRVHSNDVINACDATFHDLVTTAYRPGGSASRHTQICNRGPAPDFRVKDPENRNTPTYYEHLGMPPSNDAIRSVAEESGCLYTGPTSIVFDDDGMMTVWSPWSRQTRPRAANPSPIECGSAAGLRQQGGTRVPVPDGGAVFVQKYPGNDDPHNGRRSSERPTCRTNGNPIGYPYVDEVQGTGVYGCESGDAFVQGELRGQVTVAAENYIYIVGDTTYDNNDRDMLGLIGMNMVMVHNPAYSCSKSSCQSVRSPTRQIYASILSLRSFAVQNVGRSGITDNTLTVHGSIAQRYRGIVSNASGYDKNYVYDSRLRFQSPPHFLSPESSAYGISSYIETPPAFNADGTVP